jgi:hypothetical protein
MALLQKMGTLSTGATPQGVDLAAGSQGLTSAAPPTGTAQTAVMIVEFAVLYAGFFLLGHWLEKE